MVEQRTASVSFNPRAPRSLTIAVLNLLLSMHVVWFYLSRTPSYLRLDLFEQGKERTPFQYRLLMVEPLAWAHRSTYLTRIAAQLSLMHAWFPSGVSAAGILQAAVDLVCVVIAGLVARELYRRSSPTGLLRPWIYSFTMLLVLSTYALATIHIFRFVYDLPSLAFFSLGLLLIYVRAHPGWLAPVFLIGTTNRETTLLLLAFFLLAQCNRAGRFNWRALYCRSSLATVLPLGAAWLLWRLWVVHRFAANPSAAGPRLWLNLATLLIPFAWPQLASTIGVPILLVFAMRRHIRDSVLRTWVWALPLWFAVMLHYGLLLESRIFGELIPYLACAIALIAEETLLLTLKVKERILAYS